TSGGGRMEHGVAGSRDPLIVTADGEIELRHASTADCDALYAVIDRNRARLREWLPWLVPGFDRNSLFTFLQDRERDNAARVSLTTNIWMKGELCGAIGLHSINQRDRSTSVGYWLDARYSGRGVMKRACH